ncbi:hypothetical protein HJG53_07955 [Sphingomonas sp. ID1715]|uniref:hypothetical protein n=1 Tax=Sphingomonas sp. ID1715 TaxID=1656898 RepID=UPI0014876AD9|nr:hypothetical protein [Sphingomonas sp. ID1715]NNM76830.1 hypothetical protein [Sphingomonas sp. ID1715]
MSDTPAPHEPTPTPAQPVDPDAGWMAEFGDDPAEAEPSRRGSFDRARKKLFLKALARGATMAEAARAARIGKRTVYEHVERDRTFAAACRAATEVVAPVIELEAFKRGVTGVEEDVISYGKHVGTRVKRSDAILQTLLKGSNPDKYGPHAGSVRAKAGKRKWRERERQRIREELIAEQEAHGEDPQVFRDRIARRLDRVCDIVTRTLVDEMGWTRHEETERLVPPGWRLVPDEDSSIARAECADGAECAGRGATVDYTQRPRWADDELAELNPITMGQMIMQLM